MLDAVIVAPEAPGVSVVIPTYARPEACARAAESALAQTPAALEVIICDDSAGGSARAVATALAGRDPRVSYVPTRTGSPARARNEGVRRARGSWVAFLDDDDLWLPGKLAAQLDLTERADLIGTNALRGGGARYLPLADGAHEIDPRRLHASNPLITSSVLVRRDLLREAGGFPTARWLVGIEDYGAWLSLADRGARTVVLGQPLVQYADEEDSDRLSAAARANTRAVMRLFWSRWARRPHRMGLLRAAVNQTHGGLSALRTLPR